MVIYLIEVAAFVLLAGIKIRTIKPVAKMIAVLDRIFLPTKHHAPPVRKVNTKTKTTNQAARIIVLLDHTSTMIKHRVKNVLMVNFHYQQTPWVRVHCVYLVDLVHL